MDEKTELLAILKNKETFEEFKSIYFAGDEKVPYGIAKEFYEEYIHSKMTLQQYIEETTEIVS